MPQSHFAPHGANHQRRQAFFMAGSRPLFISHRKVASSLRRSHSSRRASASLIIEPHGAVANRQGSSVHAVRARPLQTIKNNIEPDEQREEADTIPPRGVNPESRAAPGLRPTLYPSVGLVATLLGLGFVLDHEQGLTPPAYIISPHKGAWKYEM